MEKYEVKKLTDVIRAYYLEVLELCDGNQTQTARLIGISERTSRTWAAKWARHRAPKAREFMKVQGERVQIKDECFMREPTAEERDEFYNWDGDYGRERI